MLWIGSPDSEGYRHRWLVPGADDVKAVETWQAASLQEITVTLTEFSASNDLATFHPTPASVEGIIKS